MRSFGFLFSRRWVLFTLVVILVAWATWWLGTWQFGRLHERRASNAVIEANESKPPAKAAEVLANGVSKTEQWRQVTVTGTYDDAATTIIRYRTSDSGASGVQVVVPLVTADGTAVAVDRGWMPAENGNASPVDAPAAPGGTVTVVGWARTDATGSSTAVEGAEGGFTTRAISGAQLGQAWGMTTFPAFMEAETETPPAAEPLVATTLPDLGEGPHFFYGLQWWFFGVLAVGGFFYLAYDEWRRRPAAAAVDGAEDPLPEPATATTTTKPAKPVSERARRKAARRAAIEAGLAEARAEKAKR